MWDDSPLWDLLEKTLEENARLIRVWNRFVGRYNATVAPRDIGRPLAASEAQIKDVLKRHRAKASLRTIAAATSLSVRTVRTIIDKDRRGGRAGERERGIRKRVFDKVRAADFRARKRQREAFPAELNRIMERHGALLKAAKGLGEV